MSMMLEPGDIEVHAQHHAHAHFTDKKLGQSQHITCVTYKQTCMNSFVQANCTRSGRDFCTDGIMLHHHAISAASEVAIKACLSL